MLPVFQRLFTTWHDSVRTEIFSGAWEAFLARPLFGWGTDGFFIAYPQMRAGVFHSNPHNDILWLLTSGGLVGLGLYLWFLWELWKVAKQDRLILSIAAGIFLMAKVNPMTIQALVVMCLLCGRLHKSWRAGVPILFLSCLVGYRSLERLEADRLYSQSVFLRQSGFIRRSLNLAPKVLDLSEGEMTYRYRFFVDYAILSDISEPLEKAAVLKSMLYLIKTGGETNPKHPLLWRMTRIHHFVAWKPPKNTISYRLSYRGTRAFSH